MEAHGNVQNSNKSMKHFVYFKISRALNVLLNIIFAKPFLGHIM